MRPSVCLCSEVLTIAILSTGVLMFSYVEVCFGFAPTCQVFHWDQPVCPDFKTFASCVIPEHRGHWDLHEFQFESFKENMKDLVCRYDTLRFKRRTSACLHTASNCLLLAERVSFEHGMAYKGLYPALVCVQVHRSFYHCQHDQSKAKFSVVSH